MLNLLWTKRLKTARILTGVLGGNLHQAPVTEAAINSLKERYFKEYAAAWYDMMNSITWQPRTTNLDAVNQFHVYADPQRPHWWHCSML